MTGRSFLSAPAPTVAIEVSATTVSGVAASPRGSTWTITAHATEAIPDGAITPALNATNVHDTGAAVAAVQRVITALAVRRPRIALVVPDPVAKVSIVRFDSVPARPDDLDQLVRFHVRKSAPFRIEDAQVTCAPGVRLPEGGREYIVALARRDLVLEYEALATSAGAYPGLVDLSCFNVINAVLASSGAPAGDWLLVHVRPEYASVAIVRGRDLLFFRNRSGDSEESLADLVHQTAMYHEDRLGGAGIERVLLTGAHSASRDGGADAIDPDALRRQLEQRTRTRVEVLDPTTVMPLATRIIASPDLLDRMAPLVGVLARKDAA